MSRFATVAGVGVVGLWGAFLAAQQPDYSVLRINEVIADNTSVKPEDIGGSTTDMIEIVNTGDVPLDRGFLTGEASVALTDTKELPAEETAIWKFPEGTRILANDSLIIFADANARQAECELHAGFQIASDGTEPISIWGPRISGTRALIDQIWLPPLPHDVSFGRYPDGAGPAPVPLDQVKQVCVYYPPGQATFGSCITLATQCLSNSEKKRFCRGFDNGPGGNLDPRVERSEYSTNTPAAGEPVQ